MKEIVSIDNETSIQNAVDTSLLFSNHMGFSELDVNLIASAVSEISTNIFKYARKGWVKIESNKHQNGIDFTFEDEGPGIKNLSDCLRDGFTTHISSLGIGLGAAKRAMNSFCINSTLGKGTQIKMSKWIPFLSKTYEYGFSSSHKKNASFNNHFHITESNADTILIALFNEEKIDSDISCFDQLKETIESHSGETIQEISNIYQTIINKSNTLNRINFDLISIRNERMDYLSSSKSNLYVLPKNNIQKSYFNEGKNNTQRLDLGAITDSMLLFSKNTMNLDNSLYFYHPQVIADYLTENHTRNSKDGGLLELKKIN